MKINTSISEKVTLYLLSKILTGAVSISITLYFTDVLLESIISNWILFVAAMQFSVILATLAMDNTYATLYCKNKLPKNGKAVYFTTNLFIGFFCSIVVHFVILKNIIALELFVVSLLSNILFLYSLNVLRFEQKASQFLKLCVLQSFLYLIAIPAHYFYKFEEIDALVLFQAASWFFSSLLLSKTVKFRFSQVSDVRAIFPTYLILGAPVFFYSCANWAVLTFDRFILDSFGHTDIVVKNFLITTIMSISSVILYAINQALVPIFYFQITEDQKNGNAIKSHKRIIKFFFAISSLSLLFNLGSYYFLSMFFIKSELGAHYTVTLIYCLAFSLQILSGSFTVLLNYNFNNWPTIIAYVVSLIFQYSFVFYLIFDNPAYASPVGLLVSQVIFFLFISLYYSKQGVAKFE